MNIVFLAAGKSSRIFKEVGKPKCLLKINNQSIILNLIKNLRGLNVKKINTRGRGVSTKDLSLNIFKQNMQNKERNEKQKEKRPKIPKV